MAKSYYVQFNNGNICEVNDPTSFPEATLLKHNEGRRLYIEQIKDELHQWIKPGQTIWGKVNSVSSSSMSRNISFYIVRDDRIHCIDWHMSRALDQRTGKNGGLIFGGCGMDMIFAGVYNLGLALWPNGTPEPHRTRNGQPDNDGGYALKHSQL